MEGIISPIPLPFDADGKIFCSCDDDGNQIGEKYSYNDFMNEIESISGLSEKLFGRVGRKKWARIK